MTTVETETTALDLSVALISLGGIDAANRSLADIGEHCGLGARSDVIAILSGKITEYDGDIDLVAPATGGELVEDPNLVTGGLGKVVMGLASEWVLVLTDDIQLRPGWLDPIARFLAANPDVGGVTPRVRSGRRTGFTSDLGTSSGVCMLLRREDFISGRINSIVPVQESLVEALSRYEQGQAIRSTAARATDNSGRVSIWAVGPSGQEFSREAPHGGVKALFTLADMLRDRGVETAINLPGSGLNIVPEVAPLRPELGPTVRWMLNYGPTHPGEHVRLWTYHLGQSPLLQVPIADTELFKPADTKRTGVAVWIGKGHADESQIPEGAIVIPRSTPRGRIDVAEILQSVTCLISFDPFTAVCLEATLCGTPVVIPAPRPSHAATWEAGDYGIGWGMDLDLAMDTVHLARPHYFDVTLPTLNGYVDQFVEDLPGLRS